MIVFLEVMPVDRDFTVRSGIRYVVIWAAGIAWYLFWKWSNKRSLGADLSGVAYGELPPE